MNAKRMILGVLSGTLLTATLAGAQTTHVGHSLQLAGAMINQVGSRHEADEFLRQARTAMKQGELGQARWFLKQAEDLNVKYDGLFQRFMDTPEKVRRDLSRLEIEGPNPAPNASPPNTIQPQTVTNGLTQPIDPSQLQQPSNGAPHPAAQSQLIHNPFANRGGTPNAQTASPAPRRQPPSPWAAKKRQAMQALASSRAAMNRGDLALAERLARQAKDLQIPESEFAAGETRPWILLLEIDRAAKRQRQAVVQASNDGPDGSVVRPAASQPAQPFVSGPFFGPELSAPLQGSDLAAPEPVADIPQPEAPRQPEIPQQPAVRQLEAQPYTEAPDSLVTQGVPVPLVAQREFEDSPPPPSQSPVYDLIRAGEAAVKNRDFETARENFREAWRYERELDPTARQQLQDNLQLLRSNAAARVQPADDLTTGERAMVRRFSSNVSREQVAIRRSLRDDPKLAWERLKKLRMKVEEADIPESAREQLLSRVDRGLSEAERYIERNRPQIEMDDQNREVLAEIDRRRQHRIDVDEQLAKMVDEFNELMDQERFSEAIVLAKQARELAPENPTVEMMFWKSRFAESLMVEMSIRDRSERGVVGALHSVGESGIPFDDRFPIEFPNGGNAKYWEDLTNRRRRALAEGSRRMTDTELEIQRALKKKVQVDFSNQPLSDVLAHLGDLAGISIYPDPQGLAAEGAASDMPVSIRLNQEVQLKSALNIILDQFSLSYVIQDEVLKVTSKSIRDSKVYVETYDVGDLVIPIPNFLPSYNVGLPSAIREAYNAQGHGQFMGGYNQGPLTVLAENGGGAAASGSSVLAQMSASGALQGGSGSPRPLGFGPGGMGGGVQADFDTLIDLIVATIAPNTWDDVGGEGSIQGFPTNLSLVVSQTQEVHDQIADLLDQLRRLQDLQVTIEVRFITLNDNFFERIGVDFDFDIDDNTVVFPDDDSGPSVTIGLDPQGNPTADLDLSFTQGSFGAAAPAFGGFDAASAANFGFAIISDIEAFFLIEAVQGDTRTNVLQAPKVTLFNGQQASVIDTSQRPFVTSVTPVVGDFAAAQAPIIVVLSEGTSLNVQAVVSNDRRFVRLTLVPFFSTIGDVEEFTFEGRRVSNTGTAVQDPTDDGSTISNDAEEIIEGTTVQLPQFAVTSVSTTVSVPDGGTILLGGIKRLQEGRNERGVPILSKLPYVNRLFKNVGIGRTTQSLMMMVTPRIIIHEEEENRLGIVVPGS